MKHWREWYVRNRERVVDAVIDTGDWVRWRVDVEALAKFVTAKKLNPDYALDLRERTSKAKHRERLAAARQNTGTVDELVTAATKVETTTDTSKRASDLWAASRADAEAVVARLRILLVPDPKSGTLPSFHGPESHRGVGEAPDALHFNAEGHFRGNDVKVHIYFPPD